MHFYFSATEIECWFFLFSKRVQILKREYKYGQYCTPLGQSDCRYFFVLATATDQTEKVPLCYQTILEIWGPYSFVLPSLPFVITLQFIRIDTKKLGLIPTPFKNQKSLRSLWVTSVSKLKYVVMEMKMDKMRQLGHQLTKKLDPLFTEI